MGDPRASTGVSELLSAALPEVHAWAGRPTREDLAKLPGCPAVYLLVDAAGRAIQLATTQALKRLLLGRLVDPERQGVGKTDLAEIARGVRWRPLLTAFEGRWWYYRLARELYPREYRKLISFGPAWFLQVDWAAPIPEIRVTERIWELGGEFVGPWASHKAGQEALEGLWDLFDLCRYPEQVRRAPQGKRCAYAEMGRCDAPCDGSAPLPAYVERCRAAWAFAEGGGSAGWVEGAQQRMRATAAEQNFEKAAQLKQQIRFAERWRDEWGRVARPAVELNYLIALPATRRRAWKTFVFRAGELSDGPVFLERKLGTELPAWLAGELAKPGAELAAEVRMEQTWLLCHLLFSREAERSILVRLPRMELPVDLPQMIAARVEEVRKRPEEEGEAGAQSAERG